MLRLGSVLYFNVLESRLAHFADLPSIDRYRDLHMREDLRMFPLKKTSLLNHLRELSGRPPIRDGFNHVWKNRLNQIETDRPVLLGIGNQHPALVEGLT